MDNSTIEQCCRFISEQICNTNYFWLEFFGGEPTLCMSQVTTLATFAKEYATSKNVKFTAGITTNGSLLNGGNLDRLHQSGVTAFQITLDGPPDFHNKQRTKNTGGATWDEIWSGLLRIKSSNKHRHVTLRIHYSRDNMIHIEKLITEYLNPEFSHDKRFYLLFHEIKPLGGPFDNRIKPLSQVENIKAIHTLQQALSPKLSSRILGKNNFPTCYAGDPHSVVVLPNGDLVKCTTYMEKIGHLSTGAKSGTSYAVCDSCFSKPLSDSELFVFV